MKRIIAFLISIILSGSMVLTATASNGTVIYDGNAREFIFEPGSEYSPIDLFSEFKSVMPGDSLKQKVTVRNEASEKVKVKIYLRALGASDSSAEFLSQLGLRVAKSNDNNMAYMFDATADKTEQLTDWVCLGTLYSGGEVNLDVILDVPVSLDNKYSNQIGYLDWQFMVEEFPIDEDDPKPPQTGDTESIVLWSICAAIAVVLILILLYKRKQSKR